uniref:N-acetyltransferase domain-containing protein n=1 Tax=Trichobilharzia regenti TaxID=157069 RepID=A0AA85JFD8_TRIRE|nr:unnamed protein product [Trichobilharzia regenti]
MRLNRETVVETTRLFLVPYLATHVTKYHRWMQCSWLRESTSSESLSLDEEFEAQKQWCNSDDRLTFILLSKQLLEEFWSLKNDENPEVYAMIGDVNLFLTPGIGDDDFEGELSVMIAESKFRGQRLAAEALAGILEYSGRHLPVDLTSLVAKVSVNNEGSVKFFKERLQFIERSRNNIFNEIEFIPDVENLSSVEINSSEFKNQLALKTSQAIINRLLATSPELSASSTWYYKENELKIWRDKQKK